MPATDDQLALGIIGAGIMGERLLGAIHGAPDVPVRVAAIWDPAPEALARIGAAFPAVPLAADAESVVAASACLYVASPPASHLGYARTALAAGRSVFCEKPLAIDLVEARAFAAEAGSAGAVNFPFASSPGVAALRRWIAEGAVGTPLHLAVAVEFARWPRPWQADAARWLDARAEGGFTREVVSHFLFLARRLLGPLEGIGGAIDFPEAGRSERAVAVTLTAGGIPVSLTGRVGGTDKDDHNTWTLTGDAGAVRLRDWAIAERLGADGRFEPEPGAIPNEKLRPITLRRQLEGVVRMVRGEPHHLATFAEALAVQEAVEAILAL
ncbi:Gfo/Idh/MocA family oxidoreductase [Methylobacterium sp. J-030]|uniref:Gfo/Idh/MocA family protein n=1 Tax=Methylobacterium sp. J-030 TaxID=2836627 RepID=UPI001FB97C37|nr:Gfo/Idh/MocA family oxidoreductase [Methylobacterium sp. J-030]MCJ2072507.1 Gfo/Idh/MocA family oxidoreductase [Methylobacterium sp. J-030]